MVCNTSHSHVASHDWKMKSINSMRVRAGTNNTRPVGFLRQEQTERVLQTRTQLTHKHRHHGGAVCPSYGVVSLDTPDRTQATSSEGVGQERFSLVQYKTINNRLINLILLLLVYLTNRSHAVDNGGQTGIHNQRREPILYEQVDNILMNILVTGIKFIMTITWSLAYSCGQQQNQRNNKCRQLDDNFDTMRMRLCNAGRISR